MSLSIYWELILSVTFAAVIVPVMVPEVAAGHAGWPPPPQRNIITPPATLLGAKCRCATESGDDSPEKLSEKVMVFPISMWNVAKPAVLIGGMQRRKATR